MIKIGTLTNRGRITWIDQIFETIPDPMVKIEGSTKVYKLSELIEIPESIEVTFDAGTGKLPDSINPELLKDKKTSWNREELKEAMLDLLVNQGYHSIAKIWDDGNVNVDINEFNRWFNIKYL